MADLKKDLQQRLKTINGQIGGIAKMVDEEADCFEVITQIRSARGGLDRLLALVVGNSLTKCLTTKKLSNSQKSEVEKLLAELLKK